MMTALNTSRLVPLMPAFGNTVAQMITQCEANGVPILITQGLRTWDEQHALYAQGRLSVDVVNKFRQAVGWAPITQAQNSSRVTQADSGLSFHNYGVAVDIVPLTALGKADWTDGHPDWQIAIQTAASLGLEHGDRGYKDNPHFQMIGSWAPNEIHQAPEILKALYKSGDLSACWAEIQRRLG